MVKPGTSIGVFEVTSLLGTGGMGEVYRAHDARLKRDVALKLLPEFFAGDPERLARFQREAQVLASLNHPHVAGIYGLEESNGRRALVLELVEGETLADRIARGPIPLAEALPLARQIAEALEYAHEHGVVHRDLKPANVKVAPDGTVKVLDFGLAKLTDSGAAPQSDISDSPTMAAVSRVGMLLGTAAYMSPEQARRKAVDRRSDVWSFGCVLYEMLTGRRVFDGEEAADILANVLKSTPDWTRLPSDTPASIRTLLRRCLERDRAKRLPDIGSARLEIVETLAQGDEPAAPALVAARSNYVPWGAAAAAAIVAAVAVGLWSPWRAAQLLEPARVAIEPGVDAPLVRVGHPGAVLSPDGQTLVLVARPPVASAQPQLYVRRLSELRATPLAGTEGAAAPFFSPDGQWVGFVAGGALKKVAVTGGAAVTLATPTAAAFGATWTDRDTIVYLAAAPQLREVSANGGNSTAIAATPEGTIALHPQALPGATAVIATVLTGAGQLAEASVVAIPTSGGEPQVLVRGAHFGRYVETGHLLYMTQGTVFAAPFDVGSLTVTGNAVPLVEGVQFNAQSGAAQFATSRTGTLVYSAGTAETVERPMSWLDQRGGFTPIKAGLGLWGTPRFAPDGNRLAITRAGERGNLDVWTYDLERDTLGRVTLDAGLEAAPAWTADGRRIAFGASNGRGPLNLFWKRADGTGEVQRLTESKLPQLPSSWHPTRPILAFHDNQPPNPQRVMLLELDGDEATGWKPREPVEFIGGAYRNVTPVFSPDGNWLAYLSDKAGTFELYVRPFPGPGDEVQVSSGGANDPKWSRQRQELLFSTFAATANPRGRIMVAPYTVRGGAFIPEKPRPWSPATVGAPLVGTYGLYLDLHPDGQRFVVASVPEETTAAPRESIVLVFNFFDELRRRVATVR